MLQFEYQDEKVRKILCDARTLQRKVGLEIGKKVKLRLNQLEAVNNFNEYLTKIALGKPHLLEGNLAKCYGISITANYRLIVEPLVKDLDLESLKDCKVLNIKGVLDYHGGKMNGLSLDFIIHPGETIKEVLEERQMSQEELAIRTGFSPKHVSEVVNGKKGISPSFAKSLEYVFGMPSSFWINLQGIYDKEILEYKEQQEIDESEVEIVKGLKKLIKYAEELEIMSKTKEVISQIIELRNICNVQNLTYINNLVTSQVAFRKSQTIETNIYVLYVWLRICEIMARRSEIDKEYDEQKLKDNISNIKKCMFLEIDEGVKELKRIFAECGIIFQVVQNFQGAPVQGFIKKVDNKIVLSMTIRGANADVFWFTLFHEIGHLLNGDIGGAQLIDYTDSKSDMEDKADKFAREALINEEEYNIFVNQDKITEEKIVEFAREQGVMPFIVVGRIQKEKNDYRMFYKLKLMYKWN